MLPFITAQLANGDTGEIATRPGRNERWYCMYKEGYEKKRISAARDHLPTGKVLSMISRYKSFKLRSTYEYNDSRYLN